MADNELDKSIEELEAEVLAELEEATHDAPTKGAVPAEPMKKTKNGEVQDLGKAVTDPMQKDAPSKKASASAKEVGGDAAQKGEGKPEKMKKLAANEGYTDDEIRKLCHSKDHDCATVVEHPVWGKGKPILRSHAIPDDNGYVEWYDVQFKHGIEEKVMAEDMIIEGHNGHGKDEDMEPKTKMQAINAMMDMMSKMKKMKKDEVMNMYNKMMPKVEGGHEPDEEEEEDKDKMEAIERRIKEVDVSEHVEALVNGEGDLSEEFKRKAATVFEAAVKSKVRTEIERLEDEYESKLNESVESATEEMVEKVDTYLNYVTEEWMKENEIAVERGLKGEIAEDFISGLKQLFEDHYIDVPDEKYDILEAQSEKISELEGKLSETIEKNVSLKDNNAKLVREQVMSEVSEDLADTEVEKFKSLTEDVDYSDEESFREKLDTLKENYFPKQSVAEAETVDDVETGTAQDVDLSPSMDAYTAAIGRTLNG
tara:strand:- start:302 stop:1747 length:1446 start_codon:yes stop_codon:yes gene_type:complete